LLAWPIRSGESFELTYTHSLNLSPITDVIEWSGSELVIRKSIFESFGAGVPVLGDGVGTELVRVGSRFELTGINTTISSFTVITHELPNHRISIGEIGETGAFESHLIELVGSGKPAVIEVRKVSSIGLIAYSYAQRWRKHHAIFQEEEGIGRG
jgi:hypothetical protein